jgi:hypothetical protein
MVTTMAQKDKALCKALVQKSSYRRQRNLAVIEAVLAAATVVTTGFHTVQDPILMRTSMLTGHLWLDELLKGHSTWFQEQMRMAHHVFYQLSNELQTHCGLSDSKHVTADEQIAIYLHLARTGLSSQMLQERFQQSGDTISKYVLLTLPAYH